MNILNIELTSIEETNLGFEHWVNVTYSVPILKNEYTVKLLLLLDFKVDDKELLDYLVSTWKYRDLLLHSVDMHKLENIDNYRNFGRMLL
ncbi:hypothetical protein [Streptococcus oralis]|uniref:DUF7720 domain-containing protein n=1 Tax=Streptococcus oralis subsp. oralis TaxID=1891914 RepID=A0A0F2CTY4_STROR|nr:hypothetical protein [Streptococcus oralis]KJQ61115.1 hypothetical protein TZ87_01822 [Streptococcus oralis subsp. oralis]